MTNREQLVDALFAEAVDLSDSERELFFAARLAEQGAEPALLDELKALLTNYRRANANEFLNQPLVSGDAQTLNEGQEFEGYRIARLIGEGGMGEVYLAEDPELKRKVALKLIKGHATKDILRRFQSERQILANLKHANIAQLYEAGATADGLPFFAMEYVEGDPIDKFVADCGLTLNEGLKLFATVCSAISYAHQNLIIHRDIKPGNILVTKNGEPKLLDFGIAKLLQDESEPDATASMFRALTPQYASPEQIKGEPITTASDIYSLGTLLYELVTGQRPYRLKGNTAAEITKAICEQDPTKPSNVRNDAESGRRGDTEKKQISASPRLRVSPSALRGDLDNIILKALRKEPSRRYASVEQFSEDIRRHLEGLPVTAHKDSFAYRTTKFIKRNKIAVAAALMILLTLTAGIIATTVQARRANRRFNQARQLAHTILFDYHDEIAALPGSTKVRERMVKDALQYLDSLSQDAGNDVSLLREVAIGYEKTATVQGGGGSHVKAYGRYQ
ncbi:MAG TPA: serine/threonine-protein kinase [Pyrinomonadaceae bacterium]|nr:serine/threonine-protein kinase [Pyrinomonadaceae bacterium]